LFYCSQLTTNKNKEIKENGFCSVMDETGMIEDTDITNDAST
jgi:hypothetical protein